MLRKVRQYPVRQCGNLHLSDLSTLKFCSRDSEIVQERNEVALANPSPRYEHVRKLIVGLGNPGDKFTNTRHNIGFIAVKHFLGTYVSEVTRRHLKLKYDASSHGDVVRCRLAFQQKAADKKYAYPIDDLVNLSSKRAKERTYEKGVPHEMVNVALLLPSTYMNCSGTAVRAFMKSHRWQLKKNPLALNRQDELLVISDDVALPFGECRFKPKGGSGGQNGVRDIIKCLGTERFARLRIGIGAPYWFTGGNSGAGSGTAMDKYVLGRFNSNEQDAMPDLLRYISELIRLYLHRGLAQATTYANSMDLQGYLKATRFE